MSAALMILGPKNRIVASVGIYFTCFAGVRLSGPLAGAGVPWRHPAAFLPHLRMLHHVSPAESRFTFLQEDYSCSYFFRLGTIMCYIEKGEF
jgi:hypothetical protein